MFWKLNRIQYPVYNLGEGKRIAIWVQGCTLNCAHCINPDLQDKSGGKLIDIQKLADQIIDIQDYFDGITITGGEPFQQYQQLITFCTYLKRNTNLEINVFTGYYLEELEQFYKDNLFKMYIDYLTDGRYVEKLYCNDTTRGSTNQRFFKFENSHAIKQKNAFPSNKVGIRVDKFGQVFLSGILKKNELKKISQELKKSGIDIHF